MTRLRKWTAGAVSLILVIPLDLLVRLFLTKIIGIDRTNSWDLLAYVIIAGTALSVYYTDRSVRGIGKEVSKEVRKEVSKEV
jgi:hypothetical protein